MSDGRIEYTEMDTTLIKATENEKSVIRNLLQLYMHDFSEYTLDDVNEHGEYVYNRLDYYWSEPGRHAFILRTGSSISGFALIREKKENGETIHSIAEYFIVRKYRRRGIGREIAARLFGMFPGRWEVPVLTCNAPGLSFWEGSIKKITGGNYKKVQEKGWPGPVFTFTARDDQEPDGARSSGFL